MTKEPFMVGDQGLRKGETCFRCGQPLHVIWPCPLWDGRLPGSGEPVTASPVLRTEPQGRLGPDGRVPTGAIEAIVGGLKRPDKALILSLPSVSGHCLVGGLRGVPFTVVRRLRAMKLIDERWTWASGATPDVGLTPLGLIVRAALSKVQPS